MLESLKSYVTAFGKWGFVIAAIIIGDVVGITQSYFTDFIIPTLAWWILLIVILIVTPFFIFHKLRLITEGLQKELDDIKNAKPNIVFKRLDESYLGAVQNRVYSSSLNTFLFEKPEHPYFTRIWIANDPTNKSFTVDAIKVWCEIEFWNELYNKKYFTMSGRWAEAKEIADGGQPIEIDQIDIPPNGRPYCIDIGLKYLEEEEFYGYNNDTPKKDTKGFRDKDRELVKGIYIIKTRFICSRVDESFWFRLTNPGVGKGVGFELIESPLPTLKTS